MGNVPLTEKKTNENIPSVSENNLCNNRNSNQETGSDTMKLSFSSIFDIPAEKEISQGITPVMISPLKAKLISKKDPKRSSLDKPESREKKTPSPKLKETWLVNPVPKLKESRVESPISPIRIPKITIKDNFRNELPPKQKDKPGVFDTPPLKLKLLRTFDGEWTTS